VSAKGSGLAKARGWLAKDPLWPMEDPARDLRRTPGETYEDPG
jgi:hypothetical protein